MDELKKQLKKCNNTINTLDSIAQDYHASNDIAEHPINDCIMALQNCKKIILVKIDTLGNN